MFVITMPENIINLLNKPYLSKSITEFLSSFSDVQEIKEIDISTFKENLIVNLAKQIL